MFLQISLTIIGAFLSVVLTKLLIQNGSAIERGFKKMDERTAEIAKGLEEGTKSLRQGTKEIANLILQESKLTRGAIKEK